MCICNQRSVISLHDLRQVRFAFHVYVSKVRSTKNLIAIISGRIQGGVVTEVEGSIALFKNLQAKRLFQIDNKPTDWIWFWIHIDVGTLSPPLHMDCYLGVNFCPERICVIQTTAHTVLHIDWKWLEVMLGWSFVRTTTQSWSTPHAPVQWMHTIWI